MSEHVCDHDDFNDYKHVHSWNHHNYKHVHS